MGKEYRAKVFKSGNSMALRLPKALGLEEGSEMVLREMQKGYSFEPGRTAETEARCRQVLGDSGWNGACPRAKARLRAAPQFIAHQAVIRFVLNFGHRHLRHHSPAPKASRTAGGV